MQEEGKGGGEAMKSCAKCEYWVVTSLLQDYAQQRKIKVESLQSRYCLLITDFRKGFEKCKFYFRVGKPQTPQSVNSNCRVFIINYNKQQRWKNRKNRDFQND